MGDVYGRGGGEEEGGGGRWRHGYGIMQRWLVACTNVMFMAMYITLDAVARFGH
jgi:hypothetical protein